MGWHLFVLVGLVGLTLGDRCQVLDPTTLEKYVQELSITRQALPSRTITIGGEEMPYYSLVMQEAEHYFHPSLGPATIFGYNGTYPGPYFDVRKNKKIFVSWINNLPEKLSDHPLPVDYSLLDNTRTNIGVFAVPHLHGAHVRSEYDGLPADYIRPKQVYGTIYDQSQNATQLFYHDHALGITRLNVYMGMVGQYIIRDEVEDQLNLPSGDQEIILAIGDRALCEDGTIFYPQSPDDDYMQDGGKRMQNFYRRTQDGAPFPSVIPEFFGNMIEVNGNIWPVATLKRDIYRLRILAATNARVFIIGFKDHQGDNIPFTLLGSDGGFLKDPVELNTVRLMGGERADILLDLMPVNGSEVFMVNTGPDDPWGSEADAPPSNPNTTGQIMKINIVGGGIHPTDPLDWSVVPQPPDYCNAPVDEENHVEMHLYENFDKWGRNWLQLDNRGYMDNVTEFINRNKVIHWDFINHSEDTHPLHLHQVEFQVCGRINMETGEETPPFARETGLKDLVECPPDHLTRVAAVFDIPGEYVVHCHMLEHEDYDMMRPIIVEN